MVWGVAEVADLRMTAGVRRVLRALARNHGSRLPVATVARETRLSPSAVRVALADLGRAGLVRHVQAAGFDTQPPRTVYWLTSAGIDVATAQDGR